MNRWLWPALLLACALAQAAPPPQVQAEIDALLAALQQPGCEFQRNGSWHSGAEAQAHLQTKREWLQRRDAIRTAEDFIRMAASQSSTSRQAYRVRCPGAQAMDSGPWLHQRLDELRGRR